MGEYKQKKKFGVIISLIVLLPMPIPGILLWFYSLLFQGLWFFLLLPFALIISLIVYIASIIVLSVMVYKMHPPVKQGTFKTNSKEMDSWIAAQIVLNIISILKSLRIPPIVYLSLYKKIFKTKTGKCLVYSGIVEHSLVDLGDNVIIGAFSQIWGHAIERNKIFIKKVKIGNNCTIGANALIMPGVEIGNNTIVGACTLVPKNMKLKPNSVYVGIPAKKIK